MDSEYLEARERFIAEDRALRIDAQAFAQATDAERKADNIVRAVRASENASVWEPGAPAIPGAMHVFPGMAFLIGMLNPLLHRRRNDGLRRGSGQPRRRS